MVITITCGQITFSGLDGRQKKERSGRGKRRTEIEFGKEERRESCNRRTPRKRREKRKTTRKERPLEKEIKFKDEEMRRIRNWLG